ncbi:30S ribosomal protein S2 [Poriferisphaera sp. WC338]|uniref:30S ribosomal protein S2 n=1 Tax=Poriferisphaera sp. WC338 TaxID=3425129 RepID=UPI003D81BEF8
MASLVKDLVEAGVHFGHRATHWNPKMAPYIYGKRNKIHIIDVKETIKGLLLARKYITKTVSEGKDILFVGTKRQARASIQKQATEVEMHWVTERWLGGTLTNFRTIRERLKRLEELERIEESGEIANYSKKMESTLRREKNKILRNLEGIRKMNKLPGAMVVVDPSTEHNAVKEARKLGIPTICLIDTDSDPDFADIPIPGNDDAMRAIDVVIGSLCAAIAEGKHSRVAKNEGKDKDGAPQPRRRSNRSQFSASADEAPKAEAPAAEAPAAPAAEAPAAAPAPAENGA